MEQVIIGVDPRKLSATIEVVDHRERLLGSGRFSTDRAGYAAMRTYAKAISGRSSAGSAVGGVGMGQFSVISSSNARIRRGVLVALGHEPQQPRGERPARGAPWRPSATTRVGPTTGRALDSTLGG